MTSLSSSIPAVHSTSAAARAVHGRDRAARIAADVHDRERARLRAAHEEVDLDYLRGDIGTLIDESIEGAPRVRRIVQDLRDFSRAGSEEWNFADIHEGLKATLNVVRNELKYEAEVVKDYGELPAVECMPSQLNQVVMNLLMNAAHAIAERGTITIRTRRDGDGVTIAIEDTGVGIPADRLAKIFDPFHMTKPVGKGTGLGLSVCVPDAPSVRQRRWRR